MIITRDKLKEITGCSFYDGSVLHERFAYKFLKKDVNREGNIIAFVAPMEVTTNLIDLEDSLNKDYIYSDLAMNFLIEIPDCSLFGGVCFQRLYNAQLGSLLCTKYLQKEGYVKGDDMMVVDENNVPKKASVSIAAEVGGAVLIHTGININAGTKAPDFAYSTNLNNEQIGAFLQDAIGVFHGMIHDIHIATSKVIV
jgi:hypothetical protein